MFLCQNTFIKNVKLMCSCFNISCFRNFVSYYGIYNLLQVHSFSQRPTHKIYQNFISVSSNIWFCNLASLGISNFNIHDVLVWRILNSDYTILTLATYFTVWSHKKHVNLRSLFLGHISHFSYPLLQQPACIIIFHPSYPQLKAPGLRSEMPVTW